MPADVQGSTTSKVTHIDGERINRTLIRRFQKLQMTVITVEITQTITTSGDVGDVEDELRQGLVAALTLDAVQAALETELGDIKVGVIMTDSDDGSTPIVETRIPTSAPTRMPTTESSKSKSKSKKGKGKKSKAKGGKSSKKGKRAARFG